MTEPSAGAAVEESSVRRRLIHAADKVVEQHGVGAVTVERAAEAAGVSRSTAFRHFGGRMQMVSAVALARAQVVSKECIGAIASRAGVFARLEAAFVYLADAVAEDEIIRELLLLTPAADFGADLLAVATETFGPTLSAGQAEGVIREDVPLDEIVRWIIEQLYLVILRSDHSHAAAVRRFRLFLTPALAKGHIDGPAAVVQSRLASVDSALSSAQEAVSAVVDALASTRTARSDAD